MAATRLLAPSWRLPTASPVFGSRSMRPSAGSGVSFVMPATSSALLLTQVVCPSRLQRMTGRSGTTASISSLRASAPGPNAAIDQPPPVIQGSSGFASAYFLMVATYSSTVVARVQVAGVRLDAARDRVDVHVLESRHDHAALEVDDFRLRADVCLGVRRRCRRTRCGRRRSRSPAPSCARRPPCRSRRPSARGRRLRISAASALSARRSRSRASAAAARQAQIVQRSVGLM